MINEFNFFHGAVFTELVHHCSQSISICSLDDSENSAYVINDRVGLYIKYSKKRLTPWTFTFLMKHQDTIKKLKDFYGEVVVVLVCNDDGIVGLSFDELKYILDHNHEDVEWVRVSRSKRSMYQVSGTDGDLNFKIARDDYIKKIINSLDAKLEPKSSENSFLGSLKEKIFN